MRLPAALLALSLAACGGVTRFTSATGKAVILYEPTRASDAAVATGLLRQRGWTVESTPAGNVHRTRSSIAIYGQHHRTGLGVTLADTLRPIVGEMDILPFLADGPGLHDAVVWLTDAR